MFQTFVVASDAGLQEVLRLAFSNWIKNVSYFKEENNVLHLGNIADAKVTKLPVKLTADEIYPMVRAWLNQKERWEGDCAPTYPAGDGSAERGFRVEVVHGWVVTVEPYYIYYGK